MRGQVRGSICTIRAIERGVAGTLNTFICSDESHLLCALWKLTNKLGTAAVGPTCLPHTEHM